jgi:peptidoglycan/xylan/chitin deacetylase (PgdA/CDA1 family)
MLGAVSGLTSIKRQIKDIGLAALYGSGALSLYHSVVNRNVLTAVMFHRVLPKTDPRWATADPAYTVTLELFEAALSFFRRHYNVVEIAAVLDSMRAGKKLPPSPLLITFDDGWSDTWEFAGPALAEAKLPAIVFVPTEPILSPQRTWWVNLAARAWDSGLMERSDVAEFFGSSMERIRQRAVDTNVPQVLWFLAELATWSPARRDAFIALLASHLELEPGRQLLDAAGVRALAASGVRIGGHGHRHVALPCLDDPAEDLRTARRLLAGILEGLPTPALTTIAIPHGYYDQRSLAAADAAGFVLIFTSDRRLTPLSDGRPRTKVLGRLGVGQYATHPRTGRLNPRRLANWLFMSPRDSGAPFRADPRPQRR